MKYNPDITTHIVKELVKIPNIRYVCAKIGIDHSTFYRWMSQHHTFFKLVTAALVMGRDNTTDVAEGIIIKRLQNDDYKAAIFWLTHNSSHYATSEQTRRIYMHTKHASEILSETAFSVGPGETAFEVMFDLYERSENILGIEHARKHIEKFVKFMCHGDENLEQIFYASYAEWKAEKTEYEEKEKKAFPDESP
ncbi:TPA: hypothetical protein DEP58_03505 [Patescibacteria group bacterium]|nr:MAG: hypothetical protein UU98_C0013G0030 [Parcubacteria group bacterium GW2011_GWD2_42_14]HCC05346.1 hypothetical protein [Patescibacteria group bacterium]